MNWGRKKKSTSSTSGRGMSSIAKMFPLSWISRLRQGGGNETGRLKAKISGRRFKDESCRADKFYAETEENFWRLSFSDEGLPGRKSAGGGGCPQSLSYDWLDETEFSSSTCTSCGAKGVCTVVEKESMDFNNMLLDMRKTRDSTPRVVVQPRSKTDGKITREPIKSKVLTRDGKLKNLDLHQLRRGLNGDVEYASLQDKMVGKKGAEGDPNFQNLAVKDIAEVEAVKPMQASTRINRSPSSSLSSQHLHHEVSMLSKLQGTECKNLGEANIAELSLGAGEERKSIYINKDSLKRRSKSGRSSKVKVYSPRTPSKAELCKIRALEDLKKTRMKMRVKERVEQEKAVLESLAVVKRSFDPQRDFRNSMLEMIVDKGISQQEELEELLACYLILNSDEYHDMIIKVFRQVWFDLNEDPPSLRDADL